MKVQLLDLKAQYKTLKNELDEALIRTAESQYFILGPEVEKLEKAMCEYLECKYAIGVSSGTDALLIALMAIDIKPGDEIIVPTYSFFATAGVVSRLNAIPIYKDRNTLPVSFSNCFTSSGSRSCIRTGRTLLVTLPFLSFTSLPK